jgi:Cu+-exporting ATPase
MSAEQHDIHCNHCGQPCTEDSPSKENLHFCCHGCLGVYEILSQYDSCEYYAVAQGAGVRPQETAQGKFETLDTSPERAHVVEYEDAVIVRARFVLPSMHCASCVWLLERLHRFDEGVLTSRVDLLRRTVSVECDKTRTSLANVALLLASLGYEPEIDRTDLSKRDKSSNALRSLYMRIGVAGFAAGNVMMIALANYVAGNDGLDPVVKQIFDVLSIGISLPVLLFSARPWLTSAFSSLRNGIVNLDVPVALGITTMFIRSCADIITGHSEGFFDSFNGLVFFLLIGKLFQQKAFASIDFDRTVSSFFPLSVSRIVDGEEVHVHINDVRANDIVVVRNGEVIPADAILLYQPGVVDYSYVTGESTPTECMPGTMLFAGGRALGRSMMISVVKRSSSSYMASLWARSDVHTERKQYADASDRFGLVFTIVTISVALLGGLYWLPDIEMSITVMTSVLIIACPCALTLSAPIAYGSAMARLGAVGIFLKSSVLFADLQSVTAVVFDKTGTLTEPSTVRFNGDGVSPEVMRGVRSVAEQSTHPVSRAIAESITSESVTLGNVCEEPGVGIAGTMGGRRIALTSTPSKPGYEKIAGRTYLTVDGEVIGYYCMEQSLRAGVTSMLKSLRSRYELALITGDTAPLIPDLCRVFSQQEIRQGADPADKVAYIQDAQRRGKRVVMIGDGLNDLAALSASNVSVAVSNNAARIVPTCDIVMDADRIASVPSLLRYSRSMKSVVAFAFWFTMVYNAIGLVLSLSGHLSPVITAVMMPASSLLVVGISVLGSSLMFRRYVWA